MSSCSYVTVNVARFDEPTQLDPLVTDAPVGEPLMWAVGADESGSFGSRTSTTWLALGLHATMESADAVFDAGLDAVPFFSGATETWGALLQPFSHRGDVNWIDGADAVSRFETGPAPADEEPFVVITSAGWTVDERFDADKAMRFAGGVAAVRSSMDGADGLFFQHVFNFDSQLMVDGATVTMWRDDRSMRAFAYRPGTHKTEMDHYRANDTADRTSFTRLRLLSSHGSVQGYTPVAAAAAG